MSFSFNIESHLSTDLSSKSGSSLMINKTDKVTQVQIKKPIFQLSYTDPGELLVLISTLHDTDSIEIQKKLNAYFQNVTNSKLAFLIHYPRNVMDALITVLGIHEMNPHIRLQASESMIEKPFHNELSMEFMEGDINSDLLDEIKKILTESFRKLLIIPIVHPISCQVLFLVGLVNYKEHINCVNVCVGLVTDCCRYCLGIIMNSLLLHQEIRHFDICKQLLESARKLSSTLGNVNQMLSTIVTEICALTNAEVAAFYLAKPNGDLVSKVIDYGSTIETSPKGIKDIKIPRGHGIPGEVMITGKLVNCSNITSSTSYTFPVFVDKQIFGVVEVKNKKNDRNFHRNDEETAKAFSLFIGHEISHNLNFKKIHEQRTNASYVSSMFSSVFKDGFLTSEVTAVLECKSNHDWEKFTSFDFIPLTVPLEHTVCTCIKIFNDLGIVKKFTINIDNLAVLLITIKHLHCYVPVKNWYHSFSSCHFIFMILTKISPIKKGYLTSIEAFALLIAALGHAINEPSSTTPFELTRGTVLASLYSSPGSIAQDYHAFQVLQLIVSPDCNIVEHMDKDQFTTFAHLILQMIRATDLTVYINSKDIIYDLKTEGFDKQNLEHRKLLHTLLMICAELSDYAKPFLHCRYIAECTYNDFFTHGDLSHAEGVFGKINELKKEQFKIPLLQLDFIDTICAPVFNTLSIILSLNIEFEEYISESRAEWEKYKLSFMKEEEEDGESNSSAESKEYFQ